RLQPRAARGPRRDAGRDEEDPEGDPERPLRPRVDPREPGQPRGLPGHADPRRRAPDRGGRRAAAGDDALDPAAPAALMGSTGAADGYGVGIAQAEDPFVGEAIRVSVFLSPLDVHVNRAPIGGVVVDRQYTPGRFLPAYRPEASESNERCTLYIQGDKAGGASE